jgi:hypothetical protein
LWKSSIPQAGRPRGSRACVVGGAEEPRLARRIRSSERRRQDAHSAPCRRRTRARSRRLSLRLRERLCLPARTPRCRSGSHREELRALGRRLVDHKTDCAGTLAARRESRDRQAPLWPEVGAGVAREFMPKRNSGPIRRRGPMGDDAALWRLARLAGAGSRGVDRDARSCSRGPGRPAAVRGCLCLVPAAGRRSRHVDLVPASLAGRDVRFCASGCC